MRFCLTPLTASLLLLTALSVTTVGRDFELDPIRTPFGVFNPRVSYLEEEAYLGNNNLIVKVVLTSKGTKDVGAIKCESPDITVIQFSQPSHETFLDPDTGLRTTTYEYTADINNNAEPRKYLVTLSFSYPDHEYTRKFELFVGVRNNGKGNGEKVRVVFEQSEPPEFFTGGENKFKLELENRFPDYSVNIQSIAIRSDPPGMIHDVEHQVNVKIGAGQQREIGLPFQVPSITFPALFTGFGDTSRLIFKVTYDDTHGRVISDASFPLKVKIRPRDLILYIAMCIGVIVGAVIKIYLQHLQQKGVLTRREVIGAVSATVGIGLVVTIIALVGRIRIVAFDQSGSYDRPMVIFVIGLAGALGGAQLLSMWFKKGEGHA